MKRAISVGLGKLVISLLSIYVWKLYADNLSLAQIGIITLLVNFDSLFGLVAASPFGNYLSLNALADVRNNTIAKKVSGYFLLTFLLSIVSVFVLIFYVYFLNIQVPAFLLALFVLYIFLNNAIPIVPTLFTVVNKTELSVGLQVLKSVSIVAALLLVFLYQSSINAWIVASVLGVVLPGIINLIFFRKLFPANGFFTFDLRGFISKEVLLKFILPFVLMQLLMWFFFSAYRIYSGKLFDLEFLGKVGLVFTFASQFCSAFDSVITQIYQADFYRLIDEPTDQKKLVKFGHFLQKVQPTYFLFLFLGFLPFVLAFQYFIKPAFDISLVLLLSAWVFNFIRIKMNLYGLVAQVLFSPWIVSRFVAIGVAISVLGFLLLFFFTSLQHADLFLMLTAGISVLVLGMLVFHIGRITGQREVFLNLLYAAAASCAVIAFLLNRNSLVLTGSSHQVLLVSVALAFLGIIGIYLLTLQKKLKTIEL